VLQLARGRQPEDRRPVNSRRSQPGRSTSRHVNFKPERLDRFPFVKAFDERSSFAGKFDVIPLALSPSFIAGQGNFAAAINPTDPLACVVQGGFKSVINRTLAGFFGVSNPDKIPCHVDESLLY